MRCLAWCTRTTSPSSPCLLAGGSSPGASPWTLAEILSVRSAELLPFPFDTAGVSPKPAASAPRQQSSMAVQVTVLPSPRCLFDDPVQICVTGLLPQQEVTLRACLVDEGGELFQAHARYRAGSSGELDLTRSPALGGSYLGVEPMGLLWSLRSKTPYKRLAKRNVLTPFCVDLEVYEGHGDMSRLLGKCTHERSFLAEGVKRIPVREGRLKATLFLPPGEF